MMEARFAQVPECQRVCLSVRAFVCDDDCVYVCSVYPGQHHSEFHQSLQERFLIPHVQDAVRFFMIFMCVRVHVN